jgi:hypothetical protein
VSPAHAAWRTGKPAETLDDYTQIQAGPDAEKGRFWRKAAVLFAGQRLNMALLNFEWVKPRGG